METSNYIVSARKYRPTTFGSVVGQAALTNTLKNAIATDRLAHAYLFCGSRGVGKTSCARIFAKTINCENPTPTGDPCNECSSCRSFNEGHSFNIVELDAASHNGVDDIKSLVEQVMVPPTTGRYRVFIIDEVHMLTSQAFNAFLKTLEEPPSYVVFILATTEKHKIIPTILSRCQIYDFVRITINDMVEHLAMIAREEGIEADRGALGIIASKADGAMRDALSIFDQVAASSRGKITYQSAIDNLNVLDNSYFERLLKAFSAADPGAALLVFKEIKDKGFDTHFFIGGLQEYIRNLMVAADPRTRGLLDVSEEEKARMIELAANLPANFFYIGLSLCNDADLKYREATNKNLLAELLLIKLCQLLSPSPVFNDKEEGHLDNLKPLEPTKRMPAMAPASVKVPAQKASGNTSSPASQATPSQTSHGEEPATIKQEVPRPQTEQVVKKGLRPVGVQSVSLKEMLGAERSTNPQPVKKEPVSSEKSNEKYTPEELTEAWKEYALQHQGEKVLVNTMRASVPVALNESAPNELTLVVETPIQQQIIEKELSTLLPHLRQALKNDHIVINVEINKGESSPLTWSEKEVLSHIIEKYEGVKGFIEEFNLALS